MTDKLRIAIDMDEVIVDAYAAQLHWLKSNFGNIEEPKVGQKFRDVLPAKNQDALQEELNHGAIFGRMEPMKNAVEVLKQLYIKYDAFICTAAMEYPNSMPYKFRWIQEHLPFWDPLNVVFCGQKYIMQTDYLIDDSPRHFEHFGGKGLVFSALHNLDEDRYERVENWGAVAEKLL
ncbi:5' nucleotidase, NT5C type [Hirschia maritima]|uniref:5' nucleotidase, NT5C type n=1 Tax=Hirschia maritima TaxID=1121961 RepID=UPI00036DB590|nr:hypothetical protein [Hirschia maritima]